MTANIRKWFYMLTGLVSALVPILVSLNITTDDQSQQWLQLLTVVGGIIGAGGLGTAAVVVNKQQKNGTLTPAATPADQAITAIQQTVQDAQTAVSELERVKNVTANVLSNVPILGPLAKQVLDGFHL